MYVGLQVQSFASYEISSLLGKQVVDKERMRSRYDDLLQPGYVLLLEGIGGDELAQFYYFKQFGYLLFEFLQQFETLESGGVRLHVIDELQKRFDDDLIHMAVTRNLDQILYFEVVLSLFPDFIKGYDASL